MSLGEGAGAEGPAAAAEPAVDSTQKALPQSVGPVTTEPRSMLRSECVSSEFARPESNGESEEGGDGAPARSPISQLSVATDDADAIISQLDEVHRHARSAATDLIQYALSRAKDMESSTEGGEVSPLGRSAELVDASEALQRSLISLKEAHDVAAHRMVTLREVAVANTAMRQMMIDQVVALDRKNKALAVLRNRVKGAGSARRPKRIYVCGGMTTAVARDSTRLDIVESFSESDGVWRPEPRLNSVRSAPACTVYKGGLYCIGGRQADTVNASVDRFDGRAWISVASMRNPRWATSAVHYNGCIYVFGGLDKLNNRGGGCGTVEFFDGAKWSEAPRLREARSSVACAVFRGELYAIGGVGSSVSAAVDKFDGLGKWKSVAPMPEARLQCAAVVWRGSLYVLGGHGGEGHLDSVIRYDGERWGSAPPMNCRRKALAAVVYNDCIYAIGGNNGSVYFSTCEKFDGTSWTFVAEMSVPKTACAAAVY